MKKIQVKFCGGCNPHIERGDVYKKVRELIKGEEVAFTSEDGAGADLVLVIDGCPTSCSLPETDSADGAVVRIAGQSVDRAGVEESALAERAVKAIKSVL